MKQSFSLFLILTLVGMGFNPTLEGYLKKNGYVDEGQMIAARETQDSLDMLRHQVQNQEAELRTFEQKFENFSSIIESLRDQVQESKASTKEQLKGNSNALEMKIASLENTSKSLTADLKVLQNHANETTSLLQVMKQKFSDWDSKLQAQNQNIENLQQALQSLMEAFQVKSDTAALSGWTGKTYKVKSGDSLEKIARQNGTTIQAIKDLNGMTQDKIVVGKTLKLPG